ncbi:MAG: type II secretion system secretin GspD [Hydrogenothermaceae bacterium]|nr:type II secretion system secretin GspD [Hydrogenothermaceae bacterium]
MIVRIIFILVLVFGFHIKAEEQPKKPDIQQVKKAKKVLLNFRDTDISDIVEFMSEITGKNIILSQDVKGKITLTSSKPVSIDEAYNLFTVVLAMNGYAVVEDKNFVRVESAANLSVLPTEDKKSSGEMEFYIYTAQNVNVNELLNTVKPFLSKAAKTSVNVQSNSLIIYDIKANISKIENILKIADSKENAGSLYIYNLKFANAEEIHKTITPIIQIMQRTKQNLIVSPNKDSNSIVIFADESSYRDIANIISKLDTERVVTEGRNYFIIPLKYTTVAEISKSFQSLFQASAPVMPQYQFGQPTTQPFQTTQPTPQTTLQTTTQPTDRFTATQPLQSPTTTTSTTTTPLTQTSQQIPAITTKEGIKIGFDIGTNSIILYATKQEYEGLKRFIENLDVRRKQVLITATIVEASTKSLLQIGVQWQALGNKGGAAFRGGTSDTLYQSFLSGNFLLGFINNSGKTLSVGGTSVFFPDLALLFSLLESGTGFNIISNPRVLTLDNQDAEIKVGNVIPFASGVKFDINGQPIITYDYKEVGLTLKTVPRVSSAETLRLSLKLVLQEVTDYIRPQVGNLSYAVPVTSNRSLDSDIVVENGQTIVIGGLVSDKNIKTEDKVPGLGDIPIVGNLFKYRSDSKEKTTLFVFLTPYIISSPEELSKITQEHQRLSEEINKKIMEKQKKIPTKSEDIRW